MYNPTTTKTTKLFNENDSLTITHETEKGNNQVNEMRREQWIAKITPDNQENLAKRVEWSNFKDIEAFLKFISNSPVEGESYGLNQEQLNWCNEFLDALCSEKNELINHRFKHKKDFPFQHLWCQGTKWAIDQVQLTLSSKYPQDKTNFIAPQVWIDLEYDLLQRLSSLFEQTLWKEFNQLRKPEDFRDANSIQQKNGQAPLKLYETFIYSHKEDRLSSLFSKYPVLKRHLTNLLHFWFDFVLEMLERVRSHHTDLCSTFQILPEARLGKIETGLSDFHHGQKSVAIIHFISPFPLSFLACLRGVESLSLLLLWLMFLQKQDVYGPRKIVYKPKTMKLDKAYDDFISKVNVLTQLSYSDLSPLKSLKILCYDGYGFSEFVEHIPCESNNQLPEAYTNIGRLTAVLYVLGATDCHHENLIFHKNQWFLIDVETLLEPELNDNNDLHESELSKFLNNDSVLQMGILPSSLKVNGVTVDMSATGVRLPMSKTHKQIGWRNINTDVMIPGEIEKPVSLSSSLPVFSGYSSSFPLGEFQSFFYQGFKQQMEVFLEHKEELIKTVLCQFKGLKRRIVLRPTILYLGLQEQMLNPESLTSEWQQSLVLEQLSRCFLINREKPQNWPIFYSEVHQMQKGDVPFLEHTVNQVDMELSDGQGIVKDFIRVSGLEKCTTRLANLSEENIEYQLRLINGVINAKQLLLHSKSVFSYPSLQAQSKSPNQLLRKK